MSLETDLLLDRRRLKRRLFFWRSLALLAALLAVLAGLRTQGRAIGGVLGGPRIARLSVQGFISDDPKLANKVAALATDNRVKALIVSIDSPGGSVAGGEALHDAIARVAARKPVVAVMGALGASAGYMVAVPAARIFAREATLTGSIGVLLQTGEASRLLDRIGIGTETFTSGPLKDQPGLTHPTSPQGQQVLQALVEDMYEQFVAMVATGRHMDPTQVRELADGRAYTGRQALKLGLIDAIGGERDARDWLASAKSIPASLPVEDLSRPGILERSFGASLGGLWKMVSSQGVTLDGALAVWQP